MDEEKLVRKASKTVDKFTYCKKYPPGLFVQQVSKAVVLNNAEAEQEAGAETGQLGKARVPT